ncbi:hypothetical protein CWE13_01130 [Aliidiomarina shirensis]|uniref:Lipoprotein n=1 Tax=Aliidiomarina shirensis TaxID=1048642 RepID=A0A432WWX3_9GAMM|nr:hypothetical protein [Aliidiomarina shirensis]RUO38282.1 hypothetical protein CWE13_01130 [Aliidiomarina shirensis]
MAFVIRFIVICTLVFVLGACASTENANTGARTQTAPNLQQLSNDNIGRYLVQGRTQVHDIQRWWGRPQAQGESGDFRWYNYTWVGAANAGNQNAGETKMVTLTVYFMTDTGLLADYDLQVRQFPAHSQNR